MSKMHLLSHLHARCFHVAILKTNCGNSKLLLSRFSVSVSLHSHRSSSQLCQRFDEDRVSTYSNYVLQLFRDLSKNQNVKILQGSNFPSLLYQELGGKNYVVLNRLQEVSSVCEQIEEKELQLKDLSSMAEENKDEVQFLDDIEAESKLVKKEIMDLREEFVDTLIQDKELEECEGAILEVRAGVGGQEAMLFAMELYDMYYRFCDKYGLDVKELDAESEDGAGGLLKASCIITSPDGFAYSMLRFEAGVHRVQRVPATERRGRIHTSTVSVAVIPKLDTSTFHLNPNDISKSFTTSPGKGGQHVNKTNSCAVVRHIPSGTQIRCHATRVQLDNFNLAMEQLKQILYKRHMDEMMSKTNAVRSQQIRNRARSDKIRTYNFPKDRITDHRISYQTHDIESFMNVDSSFTTMLNALNEKYLKDDKLAVLNALMKEASV